MSSFIKNCPPRNNSKGFTLIELLIVVAILGLLATVVFVNLNPTANIADSANAKRANDIQTITSALTQMQLAGVADPIDIYASGAFTSNGITYLNAVPKDPGAGNASYSYCKGTNAGSFALGATMDSNGSSVNLNRIMSSSTITLPSPCATTLTCETGVGKTKFCASVGS